MAASLSVSIVTFAPDLAELERTLHALAAALARASALGSLGGSSVTLVDNGPGNDAATALREAAARHGASLISGHGNVGYGRGHNLAMHTSTADFHLVLNPDVAMDERALHQALLYMQAHPETVILGPAARDPQGNTQFLCKRYPTVLDLLLRGFAPAALRRAFRRRLDRYEMRELGTDTPSEDISLLSGCFMFCRRKPVAAIGGFSDAYFMYFEDYDLCIRARPHGRLAYVPSVKIVHAGGNTARKGLHHIMMFVRSLVTFFNRHGWKWA